MTTSKFYYNTTSSNELKTNQKMSYGWQLKSLQSTIYQTPCYDCGKAFFPLAKNIMYSIKVCKLILKKSLSVYLKKQD